MLLLQISTGSGLSCRCAVDFRTRNSVTHGLLHSWEKPFAFFVTDSSTLPDATRLL